MRQNDGLRLSEATMQFKEIQTKDYLTKSNLPYTDYVKERVGKSE